MNKELFVFKPCKTTAAFQATPKKAAELDMVAVKSSLEKAGYKIELSLKDLIIAKKEKYIVNVFKNCKIMVKNAETETEARKVIEDIYKKILKNKKRKN